MTLRQICGLLAASAGSKGKLAGKGGKAQGKDQGKGKKGEKKREKPAPVDAATLDLDMDACKSNLPREILKFGYGDTVLIISSYCSMIFKHMRANKILVGMEILLWIDWHKAGKGPDPKLAALDREIDEYNNARQAQHAPATAPAAAEEEAMLAV